MKRRADELVVFLGPSLPADEARKRVPCTVLPPARQGDVWRALALRPRAIALVDGVFEAQPSVWHHELLAALEAGVAVFGGSSMGALRAVELAPHGMVGVGRIFGWYRDGVVSDDAEVALLHADAEHGWRPLTVPLVNVRHLADRAREAGVLEARAARALVAVARAIFYQERTWARVLEQVSSHWSAATLAAWRAWFPTGKEDLKRLDALACLDAASAWVRSGAPAPVGARREPSSLVRRRRLMEDVGRAGGHLVSSGRVVAALSEHPDATELAEAGLRRALLVGWARSQGLTVGAADIEAMREAWWTERGVPVRRRAAWLEENGLDDAGLRRLCEDLALERLLLTSASRMLPDGPSWEEALASEARLRGLWAEAARALSAPGRRASPTRRPTGDVGSD
ncbi:hypothetical protein LZ198_01635 [Myxococcus sp. K15C18031901]|uniref:TfuA-like protein n=1 Tax=Myxococcus dinghuensis TaxID=2906761 RepID=UPI0020A6E6BE|nr:TfuA-like protein [Myxococcus dinghuensis]MCP3097571.1 hypothetical protein [Myxococcus dinghuensis]